MRVGAAIQAGLAYFVGVFACGFVLGTVRTLWLEPAYGKLIAVAIEAPFILAASWIVCGVVIARVRLGPGLPTRLVMGLSALVFLFVAEAGLAIGLFERTPTEFATDLVSPSGMLGLAGQVVYALFPALQRGQAR